MDHLRRMDWEDRLIRHNRERRVIVEHPPGELLVHREVLGDDGDVVRLDIRRLKEEKEISITQDSILTGKRNVRRARKRKLGVKV